MFEIVTVPPDAFDLPEQLGTKRKFWFRDQAGRQCLFKEGRPNTGENWAEKVSCEICALLEIPHASYELATWRNSEGVVSPTFVPTNGRLILGNEVLTRVVKGYDQKKRYRVRQHTVSVVMAIMREPVVAMPLGYIPPPEIRTAAGVLVGYLMVDALIGNQDRHHENWGLVLADRQLSLAPTFDHASSLGRNELDEERVARLTTKDSRRAVEQYAQKAKSALFASPSSERVLSTVDAFLKAGKIAPDAQQYWLQRLAGTRLADYQGIFDNIPSTKISQPARDFAVKMLEVNRNRLLQNL